VVMSQSLVHYPCMILSKHKHTWIVNHVVVTLIHGTDNGFEICFNFVKLLNMYVYK